MKPYQQDSQLVARELQTHIENGLSSEHVQKRLVQYGLNMLPDKQADSWFSIFIRQFQSPLIYILLLAAVLIFFVGEDKLDAFIISGVLFFNAILGAVQEGRAQNILESLKRFIKTTTTVIRDGQEQIIDDTHLVPGDIIVLQDGNKVPADARLIESTALQVDEAMLTGESEAVFKDSGVLSGELPVYEQKNMVFKGTYIVSGFGKALVVATGQQTEIGKIHKTIQEIDADMPLKKEVDRLAHMILLFILVICVLLFGIGLFAGISLKELLVTLIALFICVVPEGLPVVLTLALVTGVYRMAKRNVLVKRMQGVEGLGRVDTLIIDKTGTLTRNELMVSQIATEQGLYQITGVGYFKEGAILKDAQPVDVKTHQDADLEQAFLASALLSQAQLRYDADQKTFEVKGDPTNAAMGICAQKAGYKKEALEQEYEIVFEIPFDSRWKYHAIFVQKDHEGRVYVIGSPEIICAQAEASQICVSQVFDEMLQKGLRVLAIATKQFDLDLFEVTEEKKLAVASGIVESGLRVVALAGLNDAIRPDVLHSIAQARKGGIKIIMATGDHLKTALYVARETGIFTSRDEVINGPDLDGMSQAELQEKILTTTVFARVTPLQKLAIIRALHKHHRLVGMTGDGVNDAPALVAADLGIAMGTGTEVAKQAADIILLDDSFTNIVRGIEQGRHIFYTLRRVILYFFATNFGEILVVLFALVLNIPLPITAAQILWLNLVTDGFLDMALTMEPQEKGLLQQQWIQKARLVNTGLIVKMIYMAIPMGIGSLYVFSLYYQQNLAYARSVTLLTMAMFQWFNAWNCRSETKSVFQSGLFSNYWLLIAIVGVFLLQILLIYAPFMHVIFDTVPLQLSDWVLVFGVSSSLFIIEEIRKLIVRKMG
jgi:calcium-translocating P-type ATPase